uniref:Uncharacterized protein n=1 Tax=Compsopogon caeruleus TaxID=31354 RepID=A0A7S1TF58_9RHOD|mmetsp:Transcript_17721/g.36782  ORF Transcript_17721/g.36782 Transcript_17721/m.36782 type:complete len:145 (+) Transcript_17721:200-634(+)
MNLQLGTPKSLILDRESSFLSNHMEKLYNGLGISLQQVPWETHCPNRAENTIKILRAMRICLLETYKKGIIGRYSPAAIHVHNMATTKGTKSSSLYFWYGRNPTIFRADSENIGTSDVTPDEEVLSRCIGRVQMKKLVKRSTRI